MRSYYQFTSSEDSENIESAETFLFLYFSNFLSDCFTLSA